jgi:hypothetical protein
MPWVDLANNQAVSFINLWDASENTKIFAWRIPVPTTQECVTKSEALTYIFLDNSFPSYSAKASNQLIEKEDIVQANGVFYSQASGTYPLIGTSVSASGRVWNFTGFTIYLFIAFNSQGINSGTINNDSMTIVPLSPISVTGTITGYNQLFLGGYYTILNNESFNITITKNDGLGGSSRVYLAYSFNTSGFPQQPVSI